MKDYYAILGLHPEANKIDIRKAYRSLAKQMHPDVAQAEVRASNSFILVKEAYEVLYNSETREKYDLSRKAFVREDKFNYRDFLKTRSDDQISMAKLICYDLLNDREAEALELYDNLTESGIFHFRQYVDREAFMDYSFLLAEEYISQKCIVKGYKIFFAISLLEEDEAYFRHFYTDVLKHLAVLCRSPLPDDVDDLVRLRMLHDISGLDYKEKDRAKIYKLISEIYSKYNDLASAKKYLYRAYETWPGLTGLKESVEAMEKFF